MRYRTDFGRKHERKRFIKAIRTLAMFLLMLLFFYTGYNLFGKAPKVENLERLSRIGIDSSYTLKVNPTPEKVAVFVEQDGKKLKVYEGAPQNGQVSFSIKPKELGLRDGEAQVVVDLEGGFLTRRSYKVRALVSTVPPDLKLEYIPSTADLGSVIPVYVRSKKAMQGWAYLNEERYPMYKVGTDLFFAILPVKLDISEKASVKVVLEDEVGNTSQATYTVGVKQRRFKKDVIHIDDSFIQREIYPLLGQEAAGLSPLEAFKKVNEEWRSQNVQRLKELSTKSEPRKLWNGPFLQLPNSKVVATYGDARDYYYKGQKVSSSVHMGYDFASVERADVPASNSGVVVYTGQLGIYGNLVLIDHGLGLMSLYGHLSEIYVKPGDYVKKGQTIGKTGKTGLALGDHLHFGILVNGYEVNPVYWLDRRWMENYLKDGEFLR
ncbi:M23 family metallopeptidase [Thermocrinis minervae]|nr:M23 family metallopeptidase [Thermocrinis minervae]